jgi:Tfp pilus assembly protein PilN
VSTKAMGSRRRSSARRGAPVLLFFLVLVLIAILTGYTLGKYVLTAWFGSRDEPASGQLGETEGLAGEDYSLGVGESIVQAEASPINLFRIQLGAFSTKERASRATEEATSKGVAAFVIESDQAPFRVVGGLYGSREAADKAATVLKGKGFEAYVTALQVSGVNLSLNGVPEDFAGAVEKTITGMSAYLADQAAFWDEVALGHDLADGRISNMEAISSELSATLGNVIAPSNWVSVYDRLKDMVDKAHESALALKNGTALSSAADRANAIVDFMALVQSYENCLSEAVAAAAALK